MFKWRKARKKCWQSSVMCNFSMLLKGYWSASLFNFNPINCAILLFFLKLMHRNTVFCTDICLYLIRIWFWKFETKFFLYYYYLFCRVYNPCFTCQYSTGYLQDLFLYKCLYVCLFAQLSLFPLRCILRLRSGYGWSLKDCCSSMR